MCAAVSITVLAGVKPAHATITDKASYNGGGRKIIQNGFTQIEAYVKLPNVLYGGNPNITYCHNNSPQTRAIWVAIGDAQVPGSHFAQAGAVFQSVGGWSLFYQMPGAPNGVNYVH